jgi:acetyltransferase-like isoleucine patch superfamily enzyme
MTKGLKGLVLRYALLKTLAVKCGSNVSVHPGVYLLRPEKLSIGDNVSIHPMCYLDAAGGIEIGNDVSIAHAVTIMSTSHNYNKTDIPIKDQDVTPDATYISDNVWIGAKATILSGRRLNPGCVIAANCVVTKDVETNTIVGGVPNKVLKQR